MLGLKVLYAAIIVGIVGVAVSIGGVFGLYGHGSSLDWRLYHIAQYGLSLEFILLFVGITTLIFESSSRR